jgi:hypothetical protein
MCGCITCHGGTVPTFECAIGTGDHGTARMMRDSRVDARPEQLWVRQSCWRRATLLGQLSVWRAGGRLSMELRWCCWCVVVWLPFVLSCTWQCVCSAAVAPKLHLFAVRVMSRLAFRYARQISEFLRLCTWLLVGNHRCAVRMQLPLRHTVTNSCRSCSSTYSAPCSTEIALNFVSSRSFSAVGSPDLPHMIQRVNRCSMHSNTYRLVVAVLEHFAGPDSRRGSVLESSRRAESARTDRTSS